MCTIIEATETDQEVSRILPNFVSLGGTMCTRAARTVRRYRVGIFFSGCSFVCVCVCASVLRVGVLLLYAQHRVAM